MNLKRKKVGNDVLFRRVLCCGLVQMYPMWRIKEQETCLIVLTKNNTQTGFFKSFKCVSLHTR